MMRRARLDIGPAAPGWMLRFLIVGIAAAAVAGVGAPTGWVVVVAVVAMLGAVVPQTGAGWMAAAVVVLLLLVLPAEYARAVVAVVAVHALHALTALSLVVKARARVSVKVLLPVGRRFILIQLIAQSALACVLLIPAGGGAAWAAIVGAGAVLLLAIGALILMSRSDVSREVHSAGGADVGGPS